jgi:hypothetical protein
LILLAGQNQVLGTFRGTGVDALHRLQPDETASDGSFRLLLEVGLRLQNKVGIPGEIAHDAQPGVTGRYRTKLVLEGLHRSDYATSVPDLLIYVQNDAATTAIVILTDYYGGCDGGRANAKVVIRFCQSEKRRKTVIDRRRSKKRLRAPVLLMACNQRS